MDSSDDSQQHGDDAVSESRAIFPPTTSDSFAQPPDSDTHRIDRDASCIRCGYNLRGQLPSSNCSECGAPVSESLLRQELANADSNWIKSLRNSMTWLLVGICLVFLLVAVSFVFGFSAAISNPPPSPGAPGATSPTSFSPAAQSQEMALFGLVSGLVLTFMFGIGVWLFTAPEPNNAETRPSRQLARWTLLPVYGLGLISNVFTLLQPQTVNGNFFIGAVQIINLILICIGFPAIMLYLRYLAKRVPARGLARQTTIVLYGIIFSYAGMIVGGFMFGLTAINSIGPARSGSSMPPAVGLFGLFACVAALGILVFSIWWIVLMCNYQACFARTYRKSLERGPLGAPAQTNPNPWS